MYSLGAQNQHAKGGACIALGKAFTDRNDFESIIEKNIEARDNLHLLVVKKDTVEELRLKLEVRKTELRASKKEVAALVIPVDV